MYGSFLISEFKKWARDSLMGFMIFYPLLFGIIGRFVLPVIAENSGFSIDRNSDFILAILVLMTPQIFGALTGFSILDDRDDNVLSSIKVTPLSINQYLSFRMVTVFILCLAACVFVLWFSDIGNITLYSIFAVSFLVSLGAPMMGLLINALAKNKIEGFAIMKGIGTLLLIPFISLFFMDAKELFFAAVPGFWPAKVISSMIRGEESMFFTLNQYYIFGLIYVIILNMVVYKIFLRRVQI